MEETPVERKTDTFLWAGLSVYVFYTAFRTFTGVEQVAGLFLGGLVLAGAIGSWRQRQWRHGVFLAVGLLLIPAVSMIVAKRGITLTMVLMSAGVIWITWDAIRGLRRGRSVAAAEPNEKSMASLVLLQRDAPFFDKAVLAEMLSAAWGGDFSSEDDDAGRFVVGENGPFIVRCPDGMFIVHRVDETYWREIDQMIKGIPELRMGRLIGEHQAWVSVDLLNARDEQRPRESFYPQIGRLLAQFADENTLAVFCPDTLAFAPWTAAVGEKLCAGAGLEVFGHREFAPVIPVAGDDPRMTLATEEARRRWPEFAAAFPSRQPDEPFIAKVRIDGPDGGSEFIWIKVIGIEPGYLHGTLANDPVNLGELKEGDQVEVPLGALSDWLFSRADKPVGGFTIAVLNEIQRENQRDG